MNQQPAQAETLQVKSYTELKVRQITISLFEALALGDQLSVPCRADFGVDSSRHYNALREVFYVDDSHDEYVGQGKIELYKRIVEVDAALGNGPKLNALVKKYAPQYAKVVNFHTSYDEIREAEEALGLAGDEPVK